MILNYNVPIKMIIMNDSKQSMVNVWEKLFFNNNITATESINPNYYLLAKAYGIKCINIDKSLSLDHIEKKINKFIEYDNTKPIMLNCIVDSDYCLPLVAPGKGLDEMIKLMFHLDIYLKIFINVQIKKTKLNKVNFQNK